jgi:tetratricopeptide (TPR) repeat protein
VRAARYFDLFRETGEKEYYLKAAKIDSAYRAADNNDGPLYVAAGKWQSAEKEFLRIQRVDGRNPHPWLGLGEVALTRKDFKTARHYFQKARQYAAAWPRGKDERRESLLGSGRAALGLGRLGRARAFLEAFVRMAPLRPEGRYFLGCCHEKTGDWPKSAQYFKDAVRLGFGSLEALERLSRICCHLDANRDIINIIKSQLRPWRRGRPSAKKWAKRITRIEERMAACSSKAGRGEE